MHKNFVIIAIGAMILPFRIDRIRSIADLSCLQKNEQHSLSEDTAASWSNHSQSASIFLTKEQNLALAVVRSLPTVIEICVST